MELEVPKFVVVAEVRLGSALQEETKVIVYLDAHLLQDNENFTAFIPESFMEGVRKEAAETGGWWFRKCIPVDKWAAGYYNVSS